MFLARWWEHIWVSSSAPSSPVDQPLWASFVSVKRALGFAFLHGDNRNSKLSSTWTERRRSQLTVHEGTWPAVVSLAGPMGKASGSFPALPAGMQSTALSSYNLHYTYAAFSALATARLTLMKKLVLSILYFVTNVMMLGSFLTISLSVVATWGSV